MESVPVPATTVGEVFSLFGEQYRHAHKLPVQQRKTMFALQQCRTAALGGHVDICNSCGHTRVFYNSCRNRHCPRCQGLKKIQWVDRLSSHLLPVRYFHIVFTLPSELNRLSLVNQKCVYNILFKAASESLLTLAKDQKYLHALTGMVAVLHTWGQNLMEHPHLHTLVPAGGWSEVAQSWKASRKKFFLPVKVISALFKGKFLSLLKVAYQTGELKFEGEIKPLKRKENFKQLLNTLYQKPWVVYAKKPFRNSAAIVNYLARYTHRVAIDNGRILSIEDGQVSFRWKDYKKQGAKGTMKLSGEEFIRRFLLHVLPKGFCKIRYYGIFASRIRSTMLQHCQKATGLSPAPSRFAGLDWKAVLLLAYRIDVSLCPVCKSGTMELHRTFKSLRSPPEIIRKIVL